MKILRNTGGLILALALLAACQGKGGSDLMDLSPREFFAQLQAKGDSILLVDVRTPEEFESGHLRGAVLVDFHGAGFAAEVAKLPKDKQLYVYCRSGRRSKAAVPVFTDAGFKPVRNLAEGIIAWQGLGLPVTKE